MTVLEQGLGGQDDREIASHCCDEQRAIVTFDLGFADIGSYPPTDHHGIVVLRLECQSKPRVVSVLENLVPQFQQNDLVGKFWIVNEQTVRIRG